MVVQGHLAFGHVTHKDQHGGGSIALDGIAKHRKPRRQRAVHPQTRDRTLEHGSKVIERERARHIVGNRRARRYQARKCPARNMVDRHRIVLENLAQQLAALAVYIARVEYVELLCHGKDLAKAVVAPHNLSLIGTLVLNRVVIEPLGTCCGFAQARSRHAPP